MAQVIFSTDTTPSLVDLDANFNELYSKTAWSAAGIGYASGAGGTITQNTSKSTGVTLNKTCGQIVMNAAALGGTTTVSFVLTNSTVAATDVVQVNLTGSMADMKNYNVWSYSQAGAAIIALRNISGGSLSEAVTLNFVVIKAVTS
jgi:hypothetical protein